VSRGVSFSEGAPSASLTLAYDHRSGAYAGLSVTSSLDLTGKASLRGVSENVGYAASLADGAALDLGLSRADYVINTSEKYRVGYGEFYAGLRGRHASAYVYYAPRYLGEGPRAIYLDLNGSIRPARYLRVSGHIGVLQTLDKWTSLDDRRDRYDLRATTTYELGQTELNLSWTSSTPYYHDHGVDLGRQEAVILGLNYFF
jgi:uncharacterized protein (TIGR02001 family)